ncbi:PQQ-dependent sugar dehydrogenase [Ramlibacter tataouinensis]|uniref:Candidate L-sorbosone dehydrogenase n=1 Tax=Ramlibacter tataouinensis (strain ATCC BAA-407 / DSM 14655 / LMG 21543 / TTB310) TaxID=365046 RepID=F5XVL0_RAMTT|nr:sorbosone dehydrogenase family protein [Ramlibacter tataouinensis]AEG91586.1 Candidate L-sorbosone dehydrogenase [Ramlibacter tataouinensis TTB310]
MESRRPSSLAFAVASALLAGCGDISRLPEGAAVGPTPQLPAPTTRLIPTVNVAPAQGWPGGGQPVAAAGWRVTALVRGLAHPRWLHVLPNGDVLVAESNKPAPPPGQEPRGFKAWAARLVMKRAGAGVPSADRISLLRDADGDGVAETRTVFLDGLHSPFGMALVGSQLYIANADAVVRVPYTPGDTRAGAAPVKVADLPAGLNHHWTKNILASRDGRTLYATVGSNSNVGENGLAAEEGRAAIWAIDLASGNKRLFATGLRNPNGLAWEPRTGALWAVVNERDELGSDLVPDYLTSVREGGFYGWPWFYWGSRADARAPGSAPQQPVLTPDYALGNHVAPLGLAFSDGRLPAPFDSGAFVGNHGSWNRRPLSGYNVVFVPFAQGRPSGAPRDFLTGFLSPQGDAWGRPVGVALDGRGGVLVADDVGNTVWRVAPAR